MTSTMSPAERAGAMARCEAATEGPWMPCELEAESPNLFGPGGTILAMFFWPTHPPEETRRAELLTYATVEFVAHVRTDYPRLEATLRAVEAERDEQTSLRITAHALWAEAQATIASLSAALAGKEAENAELRQKLAESDVMLAVIRGDYSMHTELPPFAKAGEDAGRVWLRLIKAALDRHRARVAALAEKAKG